MTTPMGERAARAVIHRDHAAHLAWLRAAMAETAAREAAASQPLEELHERPMLDGLAWYVTGPRGREWLIGWRPSWPRESSVRVGG